MTTDSNTHVAAVQMVSTTNIDDNMSTAAHWIETAADNGAKIVLLPEYFCIMGRHDTDKLRYKEKAGAGPLQHFLSSQAHQHGIWLIGGTIPFAINGDERIHNACLVYGPDGHLHARYDKIHLFGYQGNGEAFSEATTICPGSDGPKTFQAPCGKIGLSVCYDLRFPELYRAMGPVNLIVVPSAFTYTTGKAHWEILLRARAIENQCYVLAAAQGGKHENGRRTWGHSVLIDPWGTVVAEVAEGPGLVSGIVDVDRIRQVRTSLPALTHRTL